MKCRWYICNFFKNFNDQLSDDLFDKLDEIGQHIRKNSRPFGGIQLVLCGDFYQLPPVSVCPWSDENNNSLVNDVVQIVDHSIQNLQGIP